MIRGEPKAGACAAAVAAPSMHSLLLLRASVGERQPGLPSAVEFRATRNAMPIASRYRLSTRLRTSFTKARRDAGV